MMAAPNPDLSLVGAGDIPQDEWRRLYDSYATFYEREMTDAIAGTVWNWVHDPDHEVEGVVAMLDGRGVGLAHYRRMPNPLYGEDIGFLDDLFVDPGARGHGVAEALFEHLKSVARERGWEVVQWITDDNNYRARALYDRLSKKTMWNTYEMAV